MVSVLETLPQGELVQLLLPAGQVGCPVVSWTRVR